MSARQGVRIGDDIIQLRPTWALGSAGAIAAFPVLAAVECLTLIREKDEANTRAAVKCGTAGKQLGARSGTFGRTPGKTSMTN